MLNMIGRMQDIRDLLTSSDRLIQLIAINLVQQDQVDDRELLTLKGEKTHLNQYSGPEKLITEPATDNAGSCTVTDTVSGRQFEGSNVKFQ